MLIHDDHFSVLQSALEFQSKIDGNIHFFCSDGKIEVRSTHLKVHSKLLSQIIPNNAQFEELKATSHFSIKCANEQTILLPDVKKSHIAHLIDLITFGKIQFSVTKLDEIDSFSDVISDVLSTADLLDINITNYGLDPEENQGGEKYLQQTKKGDKSVVKEIEEILISDGDNPAPSNDDEPTDKATSKEQNKPEKKVSCQAALEEEMAMIERELMNDNEKCLQKQKKKRKRKGNAEDVHRSSLLETNLKRSKLSCFICNEDCLSRACLRIHQWYHWKKLVNWDGLRDFGLRSGKNHSEHTANVNCALCSTPYPEILIGAHILGHHELKQIAVPCPKCGDMFTDHDVFYKHVAAHINSHHNLSKPKETTILIPSVDESIAEATPDDDLSSTSLPNKSHGNQKILKGSGREALLATDNKDVLKSSDPESRVPKYSYRVPQTSMQATKAVPDVQKPSASSIFKISVIHHSVLMNPEALTLSSKVSGNKANIHK